VKKLFNPTYVCLLIAVAVLAYGLRPPADAPTVEIQNASGEVQLANSKNGTAVFQTGNLAPGQQVTGTVQLSNTGSGAGDLDLSQADLVDTPGPGLGALSGALQLSVQDVTNPGSPVTVFNGTPGALGNRALGSLPAGQTRTYAFTAALPSSGDNTVSGASMSARYVWRLTGPDSGGGTGGGTGVAGTGIGSVGAVSKMPVSVKVNVKKAVKKGLIAVSVKCGEPCALNAYAAAKGKPTVRTRRKTGRVKAAGKSATIKLTLSKAGKAALVKRLAKKKSVTLSVTVKAKDPRGVWKTVAKKVKVKRP
jgi:hypothetical protein